MKTIGYLLAAVLAVPAAAAETPGREAAERSAAPDRGHSYWEEDDGKVWLQFRQQEQDWWTTSETDPFEHDRIEVNVRKSGFSGDFDVDYTAGFGREMGTIRYFASRFELDASGTRVTAEKRLDDYRVEGQVRLDNGRSVRISLDMEKEFNSENYVIRSSGLLLNVNRFGMTGQVTEPEKYPKKAQAVLAAMAMAIFQTPSDGF